MKKSLLSFSFLAILLSIHFGVYAQVFIGSQANPSAVLELQANDAGLLVPRMTDAQRDAIQSPAEGLLIFNTSSEELNLWNGAAWRALGATFVTSTTGSTAITEGVAINNTGAAAAPSAILDIQSNEKGLLLPRANAVAISNPAGGILTYSTVSKSLNIYDGGQWNAPCLTEVSTTSAPGFQATDGIVISEAANAVPHSSAMLDISTADKGLLLSRLSDAQRNAIQPAIGLIIFNTTANKIQYYTSTGWYSLALETGSTSAISGDTDADQFTSGTYSVTDAFTNYNWEVPADWTITSGQGTHEISVTYGATSGYVHVSAQADCGNTVAAALEVSVFRAFITTWNTENTSAGSSANNQVRIPLYYSSYDIIVDWGDGNTESYNFFANDEDLEHTYSSPGIYTISITGDFPRIYFRNTGDKLKIIDIVQWGSTSWKSIEYAFQGCSNLTVCSYTDAPDLSRVSSMRSMFEKSNFNSHINDWDVSSVKNMSYMFYGNTNFNQDIGKWDVSSVTDMSYMFHGSIVFNQDIGNWITSNVLNMHSMFESAFAFNQDIGKWDVDSVTNMSFMFFNTSFNKDIGRWDVSSVTNMEGMFEFSDAFDQDISEWEVSSVINMTGMFYQAQAFNQDLSGWCVSNLSTEPNDFDVGATAWLLPRPVWGTCP